MKFNCIWTSHDTLYLKESVESEKKYTISWDELSKALEIVKFKETLQKKNYKLEVEE